MANLKNELVDIMKKLDILQEEPCSMEEYKAFKELKKTKKRKKIT